MTTVAHLLRHIDDPVELHCNPLVSELAAYVPDELTLMTLVRTLIAVSVEALRGKRSRRERLVQIVLRCDLQQQLHKKVAGDLGVSMRQFYRDRRLALRQLDVALRKELIQWRLSQIVAPELEVSRLLRQAIRTQSCELRFLLLTRALRITSEELESFDRLRMTK